MFPTHLYPPVNPSDLAKLHAVEAEVSGLLELRKDLKQNPWQIRKVAQRAFIAEGTAENAAAFDAASIAAYSPATPGIIGQKLAINAQNAWRAFEGCESVVLSILRGVREVVAAEVATLKAAEEAIAVRYGVRYLGPSDTVAQLCSYLVGVERAIAQFQTPERRLGQSCAESTLPTIRGRSLPPLPSEVLACIGGLDALEPASPDLATSEAPLLQLRSLPAPETTLAADIAETGEPAGSIDLSSEEGPRLA